MAEIAGPVGHGRPLRALSQQQLATAAALGASLDALAQEAVAVEAKEPAVTAKAKRGKRT